MAGFIFGEGTGIGDPAELRRKREITDQLMQSAMSRAPQTFGEGLTAIGQALAGRISDKRIREQEESARASASDRFSSVTGALMGGRSAGASSQGSVTPSMPGGTVDANRTGQGGAIQPGGGFFSNVRQAESGGRDDARNPRSSATGRYQFIDSTWRELMEGNPELGLTPDGRNDPEQQERAMRAFTAQNAQRLGQAGIEPTDANLYAAHFLGAGGASQVLTQPDNAPLAPLVGDRVVQANPFLRDMTVGQFRQWTARQAGPGATAMEYLQGGQPGQPQASTAGGMGGQPNPEILAQLSQLASDPYLPEGQRAVVQAMLQQAVQGMDPMRQLQLEQAQLQVEQMRNPQQPDPTSGMREYELAVSQGFQGSFLEYQQQLSEARRAQTNVTTNVGGNEIDPRPMAATPPAGFQRRWDEDQGSWVDEPIPGGSVDRDAQDAAESRDRQEALTARQLNPTIDDIVTARDVATSGIGRTGTMSSILARVPFVGQGALDLEETVKAIGSGIALENLNQMRQASPTGGALGNVSDKQSSLLSDAYASLNPRQSKPLFLYNLARVENILNDIVHGPDGGPDRHDLAQMRHELRRNQGIESVPPSVNVWGDEPQPDQPSEPGPEAIDVLRADPSPEMQAMFDEVFGEGAAQRALGGIR